MSKTATASREFDLGDILSITDGRLVSPRRMDGVYDILNYMTGDDLSTIGLMSAAGPCKAALLAQHPRLADIDASGKLTPESVLPWLAAQKAIYGEKLPVVPLASWEPRSVADDVLDVARMNPNAEIIVL